MIRITKAKRKILRSIANKIWAEYQANATLVFRDAVDRANGRAVSPHAARHIEDKATYLRWFEAADRKARKYGA